MNPLAHWRLRVRLLLGAIFGAIAALGLAPLGWWPATVIGLVCAAQLACAAATRRQAGWTGWVFGAAYFAVAMNWIVEPFFVDAARHGWLAPFALFFMAGGLALFWAAAFWTAAAVSARPGVRTAALVFAMSLAELARAYVLTGFPWAAPGQVWVDTPVAQVLAWTGPHGLNLLTFGAIMPLGLVLLPAQGRFSRLAALVPGLAFMTLVALAGPVPKNVPLTGKTVRLVQPNAPQHQKWDPAFIPAFFDRQVAFTKAGDPPDLVVWPEASVPGRISTTDDPIGTIAQAARGADVVLGMLRPDADGFYNSLVHLDGSGTISGIYDKSHLVPFGEYLPYGGLLRRLGLSAIASVVPDGMLAGDGPAVMDFGDIGSAVPLICYEAVFAHELGGAGRGTFLLQITNDAWFGERSGPYQHLMQSRMRAIEQGLPMIRVANTGVSAMIDPYGRIMVSLPLGEAGYVDAALPRPLAPTIYAKTGDLPVLLVILAFFAGLILWSVARKVSIRH